MASEYSESVPDASLKIKNPNWTELEKKILVEEVHLREGVLFGKFKGDEGGKIAKDVAWKEVAQAVNGSSGSGILRTSGEAAKQYSNLKQRDSGKKKRKLTILELEERNPSLENDKHQEEIEKLKDKRQLILAKKSYYDLKLQILCNNNPESVKYPDIH
uniref:Myb/SANT-like DNA-binding domain-containing protein n=1 Tax=Magallana gigas TaxID=29159 RepID=K1Q0G2_MAGGI